jgi:hypothetical protein
MRLGRSIPDADNVHFSLASRLRGQISDHVPVQHMCETCQPVGRPFNCARKFENRQTRFQIEFTAQDNGRQRAFGGVGIVRAC